MREEDISNLLLTRRSIRSFLNRPIEPGIIARLLDVAAAAPSGGNIQPISIITIAEPERKQKLAKLVGDQPWVRNAPLVLLFCIDFHRTKQWAEAEKAPYEGHNSVTSFLIGYADVFCAAHNAVLAAGGLGLGSVYIGTVLNAITPIRAEFSLPQLVLPVVALCLGYPKRKPGAIPKLGRKLLVHAEKYQDLSPAELQTGYREKYGIMDDDYFRRTYQEILELDEQGKTGSVEQVKRIMAKLEISNTAQFLFKLRYPGRLMKTLNKPFWESVKKAGFDLGL